MSGSLLFGNCWHGKLTVDGLVLADESVIDSVTAASAPDGDPQVFPYAGPLPDQDIGATHYYKTPGLPVPDTPAALDAAGGNYMNDVIMFGPGPRYSPFSTVECLGWGGYAAEKQWLHWGDDGIWRVMTLSIDSFSAALTTVSVLRGPQFGKFSGVDESGPVTIATIDLVGRSCSSPVITQLDVKNDGRSIVISLWGYWTNLVDAGSYGFFMGDLVPYDNYDHKAIAAAWRIDVNAACSSASATRVFLAADPSHTASDTTLLTAVGSPYYVSPTEWRQDFSGIVNISIDVSFACQRLLGAGFSSDGPLHLITLDYASETLGRVFDVTGYVLMETAGSPTFLPCTSNSDYLNPAFVTMSSAMSRDITPSLDKKIKSNSTLLKTFSSPTTEPPWCKSLTNNAFDFRTDSDSICRLAPAAIDDTVFAGVTSPFASFNPRTGTVHSSANPIGFV